MPKTIRVASRTSALAMQQTHYIISRLQELDKQASFEIIPVVTKGDKVLDVALSKVGGKGLFVSEIEDHLLKGTADIAVHSLKDVPAELPEGLVIAGIPEREDARDAVITKSANDFASLRQGAVVGTSSLRRAAQLKRLRPDLIIQSLRGNINTRLRKLEEGSFDAIVLAAAGLVRMGWQDQITSYLDTTECLPAMCQGILGVECRVEDAEIVATLKAITDEATAMCAAAERALQRQLNGGCQVPMAGYAEMESGSIRLRGLVLSEDGVQAVTASAVGNHALEVGHQVAEQLLAQGAREILSAAGRASS